jgi:nucleoid-associated protein EbfC
MKFDIQNLLQQVQVAQQEMERVRNELSKRTVTAESGGEMVRVTMNGNNEVLQIKISKDIVNPDDIEMLEDLIVAAINLASKAAHEMVQDEMSKFSGMLPNIPGLNLNI